MIRTGGKFVKATQRLRPHPAHRRLRGHAGPRHRGHAPALPAARAPGHRPRPVRDARRGDRRGARRSWRAGVGPLIARVHRPAHDGGGHGRRRPRARHPRRTSRTRPSPTSWSCSRTHDADRLDEDTRRGRRAARRARRHRRLRAAAGGRRQLIEAREKAFWVAKANGRRRHRRRGRAPGVDPRATCSGVAELAAASGSWIAGCGHAGDGNVHLSVFQPDAEAARSVLLHDLFAAGHASSAARSPASTASASRRPATSSALEDPAKLALMRRIKAAFDPNGILNPGTIFDDPDALDHDRTRMNGAQALIRTLVACGVDVCFTNPGTSEMHFVAALDDGARDAGGARPVRGRRHRRGRRLRPDGRHVPPPRCCTSGPASATAWPTCTTPARAHTPIVNIVGDHATYHKQYDAPLELRHRDARAQRLGLGALVGRPPTTSPPTRPRRSPRRPARPARSPR